MLREFFQNTTVKSAFKPVKLFRRLECRDARTKNNKSIKNTVIGSIYYYDQLQFYYMY